MRKKEFLRTVNVDVFAEYYSNHSTNELCKYYEIRRYQIDEVLTALGISRHTKEMDSKIAAKRRKETCLKRYGAENPYQVEEVKEKIRQTHFEKYGVENAAQSEEVKEKMRQTKLERYGNPTYVNIEKARETIRNNNSYGLSKPEERTFEKLVEIFNIVDREHREDRYPFSCDFYIPERDMFIEYNGFWTHHTHFYDETSEEDRNQVKLWKSKEEKSSWYKAAIDNWTVRDVKKRNTARDNNLNYVVFWNEDDVDKWIADGCPDRRDYA